MSFTGSVGGGSATIEHQVSGDGPGVKLYIAQNIAGYGSGDCTADEPDATHLCIWSTGFDVGDAHWFVIAIFYLLGSAVMLRAVAVRSVLSPSEYSVYVGSDVMISATPTFDCDAMENAEVGLTRCLTTDGPGGTTFTMVPA
ncbi:MAG: hypothetical protein SGJ19_06510 [Planctomycetia bacterium]|nr:hypothetical protein [Planctomycetia bacterium]